MRNISFRGRLKDSDEWVYGGAYLWDDSAIIVEVPPDGHMTIHIVEPETVEQSTGLQDKNGVEIFEGDIDSEGRVFEYNTDMGGWYLMKNGEGVQWHAQALRNGRLPYKIIGNKFQHPELIQAG